jgi:Peptidase family M28
MMERFHLSKEETMARKLIISVILSAQLFFSPAPAQTKDKKAAFDGRAAFGYIEALAADTMMGRKSGEPGGRMAAEYIVSKLKEWGLEPAAPNGSFYQDMTFEYYEPGKGAALEILASGKKREFVYEEDWREQRYSGAGHFAADIVFVGYGISAPQKEYDDYSGVDVKGKLVLFATDSPRSLEDKLKDEARFQSRVKAAQAHGARGVLAFQNETQTSGFSMGFRGNLKKEVYKPDFVIISLENKVVEFIFKHLKTERRYLFQQIETTSKPQSFETGVHSFVNLDIAFDEKRPAQNVLAKIAGSDKNLKDQVIMLGAHMDHLGIDMTGDVFNGADDNASGTAVVMEVARVMKINRVRPKRTIVFALWAAEEDGLLGSKYYTENPVYPLDKTLTYINLDMEGHGSGRVNFRGVYYGPEVWEILKARLPKDLLDNVNPGRGGPGGSDHTHFLSSGVPAFFVATDGFHFRTNRVGDVIDLIKPEILKKAGDFVGAAVGILADEPVIPVVALRRENYYWKNQTIINHEIPPLEKVIEAHRDVQDPDVDFQLAAVAEKEGVSGDALRIGALKSLLAGLEKLRESKGLAAYSGAPSFMMGGRRMFGGQSSKTTVLAGLRGTAAFRDDLRWADVFFKQGAAFVFLDGPAALFGDQGPGEEAKKIVSAIGKANLLLIASGLDPAQNKLVLESAGKPLFLVVRSQPEADILELVKKTKSSIGLVLGKDEDPVAYFKRLDEAKKAVGAENLSIVTENCLWGKPGKEQVIGLIEELLKAKYESEDLANLFSGAFMGVLERARAAEAARPSGFMPF